MTLEQLRAALQAAIDELRAIHTEAGDNAMTEEQATRFDAAEAERARLDAAVKREESRAAVADLLSRQTPAAPQTVRTEPGGIGNGGAPAVHLDVDPFAVLEDRSASAVRGLPTTRARARQLVDANLRAIEEYVSDGEQLARFEQLLRNPSHMRHGWWAENLLARMRPEYVEAWGKVMRGQPELLTDVERAAIAEGTNAQGGYLVPTFLDPTMLLTNAGSDNVMRQYATVKTLVEGKTWNGVTTAGATASWDAELTEVSDDSPNDFGNPQITTSKPQAFIQASIEAFDDVAGLQSDVMMLFADARDRLEGAAHMTGTGSSQQPTGLFTAINASSSLQIVSTTAATIGEVDLAAMVTALPTRWRKRAAFVMAPTYGLAIRRLGTAVSSGYSGDLTQPITREILGYPSIYTDDAPTTQTTTQKDQEIVFADLSQYVIVDKPGGTSVEFVPVLFGSNGRPTGARGWWMHWRTGANMPVLQAGRILLDKTSA
jgi:HK97 family phage major capsid protein